MSCRLRFADSRNTTTSTALFAFLGISSVPFAIFIILGNILILHALRNCQALHAPTKALFCNSAIADLGVGLAVYPLFAAYCFAAAFNNIEAFCATRGPYTIAAYSLGSVSFMTITVIVLDRFFAFELRYRYRQFFTFTMAVLMLSDPVCLLGVWNNLASFLDS